ncbi:MAG: bifunctional oligoribonuclease/PAP phosphatase NrnA [Ignavibacteria bacterium]|jgi:phosphoesterase RecJ-like protein|nr:bifunctional oligoribonuclease/PAP phosphatase NrnA [Ignavibacteria bacterium]MDH7527877.1 bifunctional oligoribonuclease/PAP phosphatase NrnA [Ignavibacteria bacterium]
MIDYNRIIEILKSNNSFVITTHVNPDGDAIGSELALAYFLQKLGKKFWIINHSPTPENFIFLDEENLIQKYDAKLDDYILNADVLLAVDFNSLGRARSMMQVLEKSKAYKVIIDHHRNPQNFVNEIFYDIDEPATGNIIYKLIKTYNPDLIDKKTADALYAAIMTDTGSFRFERITPELHLIVADLISRGANPSYIYNKIYNEMSIEKLKLLGEAITNINLEADGKIAFMILDRQLIEKYVKTEEEFDVDGFVNYCLSLKSVKVGLLFFELKNGVKVSLRSKEKFPVNLLAEKFGGGGHLNAAGIRLDGMKLNEVLPKVIQQTIEDLKQYEGELQ